MTESAAPKPVPPARAGPDLLLIGSASEDSRLLPHSHLARRFLKIGDLFLKGVNVNHSFPGAHVGGCPHLDTFTPPPPHPTTLYLVTQLARAPIGS